MHAGKEHQVSSSTTTTATSSGEMIRKRTSSWSLSSSNASNCDENASYSDRSHSQHESSYSSAITTTSNRWKWSKPRQFGLWVKSSIMDAVKPDLSSVYESSSNLDESRNHTNNDQTFHNQSDTSEANRKSDREDNQSNFLRESDSSGPLCRNIDEAMYGLHTLLSESNPSPFDRVNESHRQDDNDNDDDGSHSVTSSYANNTEFEYDWLLDGDLQHDIDKDEVLPIQILKTDTQGERHCNFGDETLDNTLEGMELETMGTSNSSSSSKVLDTNCYLSFEGLELESSAEENSKVDATWLGILDDKQNGNLIEFHEKKDTILEEKSANQAQNNPVENLEEDYDSFLREFCKYLDPQLSILLDHLPVIDISSQEGRFVRRVQAEINVDPNQDKKSSIPGQESNPVEDLLPESYFTPDFDPMIGILQSIPWENVLKYNGNSISLEDYDCENSALTKVKDFITETLSDIDETSRKINSKLMSEIDKKSTEISNGLLCIQEVDLDIEHALLGTKDVIRLVNNARNRKGLEKFGERSGILGGMHVVSDSIQREKLRILDSVLDFCEKIFNMEKILTLPLSQGGDCLQIQTVHDFNSIMTAVREFKDLCQQNEELKHVQSLKQLYLRASHTVSYICSDIEGLMMKFLYKLCDLSKGGKEKKWDVILSNYGAMVNTHMVLLDQYDEEVKDNLKNQFVGDVRFKQHKIMNFPDSIVFGLSFEADRCLALALISLTSILTPNSKRMDDEDVFKGQNIHKIEMNIKSFQAKDEDSDSLKTMINTLFNLRFDDVEIENSFPLVYHNLCALLANILHAHYLLIQWHGSILGTICSSSQIVHNRQVDGKYEEMDNAPEKNVSFCFSRHSSQQEEVLYTDMNAPSFNKLSKEFDVHEDKSIDDDYEFKQNENLTLPFYDDINTFKSKRQLHDLFKSISESRSKIWNNCESVILRFLYLYLLSLRNKFERNNSSRSRKPLQDYVEGFHTVLQLSNQFLCFGQEYLGSKQDEVFNVNQLCLEHQECKIRQILSKIFCELLNKINVVAMTNLNSMLANETWQPLKVSDCFKNSQEENKKNFIDHDSSFTYLQMLWKNQFHVKGVSVSKLLSNFSAYGNPFHLSANNPCLEGAYQSDNIDLYDLLKFDTLTHQICTYTGENGLVHWITYLLYIAKRLPIITSDVSGVIINLCDLYILTVFRLCLGNEMNEKIVLGDCPRSDNIRTNILNSNENIKNSNHSLSSLRQKMEGVKKYSQSKMKKKTKDVSSFSDTVLCLRDINAEICAPLQHESGERMKLRNFIQRGKDNLSGNVDLENVEKWLEKGLNESPITSLTLTVLKQVTASHECIFISCIINEACALLRKNLIHDQFLTVLVGNTSYLQTQTHMNSSAMDALSKFETYSKQLVKIAPVMCSLTSRIAALKAIDGESIVREILSIDGGWDESSLNESCNEYIETLSERFILIWGEMMTTNSYIPEIILSNAWHNLIEGSFLALLEGFSKVSTCSTEGRALMSIDLATFFNSLSNDALKEELEKEFDCDITLPPLPVPIRGMQYVDEYIKVYYFPQDDVMEWVENNRHRYHTSQLVTLMEFKTDEDN